MGTPERRGSLQVEPGSRWTAEEDKLLVQLRGPLVSFLDISNSFPGRTFSSCKNRYERLRYPWAWEGSEEAKNELARLYERDKADMWAQVATKMAISWSEAEEIHWCLGRVQMRKRGSDDSFSTTCINLTPSQVEDAEVQARRQQKQQQGSEQGAETPRSGWSGEEETILFQCKRANMSWKSISALLPGRTIISCRDHYKRLCKLGPAWPQERQNEFCKQYESLKSSMWANIGEELNMSWEIAEGMHWRLGKAGMAERASLPLSSQAAVEVVPPRARNAEVHQHRDQEHDPIQQSSRPPHLSPSQSELAPMTHEGKSGSSAPLPSFAEITAGVEMLWRPPQRET